MIPKRGIHTSVQRLRVHYWPQFRRWQDLDRERKVEADEQHKIENTFRLANDYYISPEDRKQVKVKKPFADQNRYDRGKVSWEFYTKHTMFRYVDHSRDNIRRVKRYEHFQLLQYDQRFIPERLLFLGPDLAAAHFLVARGGKVKFIGEDRWHSKGFLKTLPGRKVEGLYLEAIDASGTELLFEGFDNLYNLKHLRLLRLANCEYIDDWALSRIGSVCGSSLEFLDLSGSKRISGKGLMGLRSLSGLRHLRLENMSDVKGITKSALLLEEALPNLVVSGLDYDGALTQITQENQLLEDERTVIDAKGNAFVEDDEGQLFYVAGRIPERPTVNDNDEPIMTSSIRRELPEMDEVEFERLNQLSNGRLRHLLVGSPSGYMWSDQVETILSHEHKLNQKRSIPTDPKLLPLAERLRRFREMGVDVEKLVAKNDQIEKLRLADDSPPEKTT